MRPAPRKLVPPKQPPPRRALVPALLLVILAALGFTFWSWRQSSRPGAVHLRAGQEAAAAHQDALAEREWRQGVQEDPAFADDHAELGDLYLRELRFGEAAAEYQAASRLTPDDGTLFLRLHHAYLGAHDPQAALDAIRRASELRPDDPDAAGLCGLLAARMQNRPVALSALRRAHALKPMDQDYLFELARQEINAVDMAAAERDLEAFLKLAPNVGDANNGEANRLLALLYKQKPPTPDNIKTALTLAGRACRALPDSPDAFLLLGQLDLNADDTAGALAAFGKARALDPGSPEILSGLVTCYTHRHDAVRASQAAAALQAATGRRNRAEALKAALRRDPTDTASRLELARLEEEDGVLPAAADSYGEAARLAPQNARAQAALSAFYGRHRRAPGTPAEMSP